jgi:hypothetical protein
VNAAVLLLFACSEFALNNPPPVPPAEPPDPDPDADFGEPPDWSTCSAGWFGQYYNLPADHPDLGANCLRIPGLHARGSGRCSRACNSTFRVAQGCGPLMRGKR